MGAEQLRHASSFSPFRWSFAISPKLALSLLSRPALLSPFSRFSSFSFLLRLVSLGSLGLGSRLCLSSLALALSSLLSRLFLLVSPLCLLSLVSFSSFFLSFFLSLSLFPLSLVSRLFSAEHPHLIAPPPGKATWRKYLRLNLFEAGVWMDGIYA